MSDFMQKINELKDIYNYQVGRRVIVNVDTTEKQFLCDMSHTLLRIEEALNNINMTIQKENGMNMVKPMEPANDLAVPDPTATASPLVENTENQQMAQAEPTETQAIEPAISQPAENTATQAVETPVNPPEEPTETQAIEPAVNPPEDITANQPIETPAIEDIPESTTAVPKADTEIAEEIEPVISKRAGRSRKREE